MVTAQVIITKAQKAAFLGDPQKNSKELPKIGAMSGHKVATVVILLSASAIAVTAAAVAAVFASYIAVAVCASVAAALLISAIIASCTTLSKDLLEVIDKLSKKTENFFKTNQELDNHLNELRKQQQLPQIQETATQHESEKLELQKQVNELKIKLQESKDSLLKKEKEVEERIQKITQQAEDKPEVLALNNKYQEEIRALKSKLKQAEQKALELEKNTERKQLRLTTSHKHLRTPKIEENVIQEKQGEQEKLKNLESKVKVLEEEVSNLNKVLEEKILQINGYDQWYYDYEQWYYDNDIENLEKNLTEARTEIDKLKKENSILVGKITNDKLKSAVYAESFAWSIKAVNSKLKDMLDNKSIASKFEGLITKDAIIKKLASFAKKSEKDRKKLSDGFFNDLNLSAFCEEITTELLEPLNQKINNYKSKGVAIILNEKN